MRQDTPPHKTNSQELCFYIEVSPDAASEETIALFVQLLHLQLIEWQIATVRPWKWALMSPRVTVLNQIHGKSRRQDFSVNVRESSCAEKRARMCVCTYQTDFASVWLAFDVWKHAHVRSHAQPHARTLQMIVFKNSSQGAPVGGLPAGHGPESGA